MTIWFEKLSQLVTDEQKVAFKREVEQTGFSAYNQMITSFWDILKKMDESEFNQVKSWLDLANELFPDLASISPSWQHIWKDLFYIYQTKVDLFKRIPEAERDGEWQVLFDNPHSIEPMVCNTNKSITEATYLMAKYLLNLKKAEFVKLQKVVSVITVEQES